MRPDRRCAPLLAALALAAGCGSGTPSSADLALGRQVFRSSCGGCHAAGAVRPGASAGGDLSRYSMTRGQIASFAAVMPTRRRLSSRELNAVAAYVVALEHGRR